MNSPAEMQLRPLWRTASGTAFTAPSHQNERTWCYRIRPSVKHSRRYRKIDLPYWKSRAARARGRVSLGQYRWDPVPHTDQPLTWLTGMRTMTTAGDVNTQVGMASHIYLVTASMEDAYFYSADSELLVVPQEGKLRFFTELGIIDLEPQEIAIIPRGLVYRVEVLEGPARGFVCENYGQKFELPGGARSGPTAWPTGAISRRRWPPSRTARCRRPSP
jgi:homogentisate 1,2-dioxygenase